MAPKASCDRGVQRGSKHVPNSTACHSCQLSHCTGGCGLCWHHSQGAGHLQAPLRGGAGCCNDSPEDQSAQGLYLPPAPIERRHGRLPGHVLSCHALREKLRLHTRVHTHSHVQHHTYTCTHIGTPHSHTYTTHMRTHRTTEHTYTHTHLCMHMHAHTCRAAKHFHNLTEL